MKKTFLLALVTLFMGVQSAFAVVDMSKVSVSTFGENTDVKALPAELGAMNLDQFMSLTPSKYKEMTGKKLGWKNSLALKAAQKTIKKHIGATSEDFPKGGYIVLSLFALGWIAMGVMDDWQGNNWWINLILSICWLPGLIHALIKMKDYYK